MKQVGVDRDCMELTDRRRRLKARYRRWMRHERWRKCRNWFFTPRGALVWFGPGYLLIVVWLLWVRK